MGLGVSANGENLSGPNQTEAATALREFNGGFSVDSPSSPILISNLPHPIVPPLPGPGQMNIYCENELFIGNVNGDLFIGPQIANLTLSTNADLILIGVTSFNLSCAGGTGTVTASGDVSVTSSTGSVILNPFVELQVSVAIQAPVVAIPAISLPGGYSYLIVEDATGYVKRMA